MILKIETIKNKPPTKVPTSTFEEANLNLAKVYMIGSVRDHINICVPFEGKVDEWYITENSKDMLHKIIFWDGTVINKDYLKMALQLLEQEIPKKNLLYNRNYELYLGWINEKLDQLGKAIPMFETAFKDNSAKINSYECMSSYCDELRATIESLTYLTRIYHRKLDLKKVKELKKELEKYEDIKKSRKNEWDKTQY